MYTVVIVLAALLYGSIFFTTIGKWTMIFIRLRQGRGLDAITEISIFGLLSMVAYSPTLMLYSAQTATSVSYFILAFATIVGLVIPINKNPQANRGNKIANVYLENPIQATYNDTMALLSFGAPKKVASPKKVKAAPKKVLLPAKKVRVWEQRAAKMWQAYEPNKKAQAQFWANYEEMLTSVKSAKNS